MLESAVPSLPHEFTARKAESKTSSNRSSTPLPKSMQNELAAMERDALAKSERDISDAIHKGGAKAPIKEGFSPPKMATAPIEAGPQLPPGVSPEAFKQIENDMTNGAISQEQALAKLEQMVSKVTGAPPEVHKPAPIKKTVEMEKPVVTAPKVTEARPTSAGESKFPALQKIQNMFGKVWDSISSFFKGITSWITK